MQKRKSKPVNAQSIPNDGASIPAKGPLAKKRPPLVSCGYDEIPKEAFDAVYKAAWNAAPESVRAAFGFRPED